MRYLSLDYFLQMLGFKTIFIVLYLIILVQLNRMNICYAEESYIPGTRATIRNVSTLIDLATNTAIKNFNKNKGKALKANINILAGKKNPYLKTLEVTKGYYVKIVFQSTRQKSTISNISIPVVSLLLGKKILLVPIYNPGDKILHSYECITNADEGFRQFAGDRGNPVGSLSFISISIKSDESPHLGSCTFVNNSILNEIW